MKIQKKDLIESKKISSLKDFLWFKEIIYLNWIKIFDSNKVSLNQMKICWNQINFCFKSNKLYLWPYINALISLFWRKIYLIQIFIWPKDILFKLNKCYSIQINILLELKKASQTYYFLSINQIFFLSICLL